MFTFASCASQHPLGWGAHTISILQTRILAGSTHGQEGQEARSACASQPVLLAFPGLAPR